MVSTRGLKLKFSEGERVLCYEPDPTKAKVLYDSKVLQMIHDKDTKGRRQVEYLIHFQGWNASWDRCVTEEYVLKDTEENRELQTALAEKAHIKLKERKRKRRLSETIRETIERERKDKEGSDTSSHTGTVEDDITSLSSDFGSSTTTGGNEPEHSMEEEISDEEYIHKHMAIVIPIHLKMILEKDFIFINEKSKLVNLPSTKNVLHILEDYVRFFAMRYSNPAKEKRRSEAKEKFFLTLDLCKEVVDGIRICFDFYLHTLLLYPRERSQAEKIKKLPMNSEKVGVNQETLANQLHRTKLIEEIKNAKRMKEEKGKKDVAPCRILRSSRSTTELSTDVVEPEEATSAPQAASCESGRSTPSTLTSYTSAQGTDTYLLNDEEITFTRKHYRGVSHHLKNWTLLPERFRNPPPPILLYGSIHLLRLFVKMPEILFRMNISGERKKIILHHIDLLLEYLNLHSHDLFSDELYTNQPSF